LESRTVAEPLMMTSGGPTHTQVLVSVAEGMAQMMTVGAPGETTGPPTWGMGGTPGVCMGQTCMSVMRAAGMLMTYFPRAAGAVACA
jgi:hypothetical protein